MFNQRFSFQWRRWRKRTGYFILFVIIGWLGLITWLTQQTYAHLMAARQASTNISSESAQQLCQELSQASNKAQQLRLLQLPISPLLRHAAWVPKVGSQLTITPGLLDIATHADPIINILCSAHADYFALLDLPSHKRLPQALTALKEHPLPWIQIKAQLQHIQHVWEALPEYKTAITPLASYPELHQFSAYLRYGQSACELLETLGPIAHSLLGGQQPKTYLIAMHNPNELRPTGGFIGSVASITVKEGHVISSTFHNTSNLGAEASKSTVMPKPYNDYLRASIWTLRDANWWPDWPTSAQTLATFWELNDQQPLDGVIAFNLYTFADILAIYQSIDIPEYGSISIENGIEDIYRFYDTHDQITGDKEFLRQLFKAFIKQLQTSTWKHILQLGDTLYKAFQEQHTSIWSYDLAEQTILHNRGWDGSQQPTSSDFLSINNADLSYSDNFMFIEQTVGLDIWIDQAPYTHTITITYANRYSDWAAASTNHRVWGYCYDPAINQQILLTGCLGNYVRIYTPLGTALEASTALQNFDTERTTEHSIYGTYLLLHPGETQVLKISYTLPAHKKPIDQFEYLKQLGTAATPLHLTTHSMSGKTTYQTNTQYHRTFLFGTEGAIIPNNHDEVQLQAAVTEKQLQKTLGWELWNSQSYTAAVEHWIKTNTQHAALDQVEYLILTDQLQEAQQTLNLLESMSLPTARSRYLQGKIHIAMDHSEQAQQAYEEAHQLDLKHPAPLWQLSLLADRTNNQPDVLRYLKKFDEATIYLRQAAFNARFIGNYLEADHFQQLLLQLNPNDINAIEDRYWLNRHGETAPQWETIIELSTQGIEITDEIEWYNRRAEAHKALGHLELAIEDWQYITTISPTNTHAWYQIGLNQQLINNPTAAIDAWENALLLQPDIELYIQLGNLYRQQERIEEARTMYQRALELDTQRQDIQDLLLLLEN